MTAPRVLFALALLTSAACEKKPEFQPGDCVEYVDAQGNMLPGWNGNLVTHTPMRILGQPAPGMYLVEWTATVHQPDGTEHVVEHNKSTLPQNDTNPQRPMHFTKVLCQ